MKDKNFEIFLKEGTSSSSLDKEEWESVITNKEPELPPTDLYTERGQLDRDAYESCMRRDKVEDFYNYRDLVRWVPDHENNEMYHYMKKVDLHTRWFDNEDLDNYWQNPTLKKTFKSGEPNVDPNSIGQQLRHNFLLSVLQSHLLGQGQGGLSREENEEVALAKSIRTDPYHKHFLSTIFRNLATVNSEIMLGTFGNPKNPDLGFLR